MRPFKALSIVFGELAQIHWPDDYVKVYGEDRIYRHRYPSGHHVVETYEGRLQLCPPDAVKKT